MTLLGTGSLFFLFLGTLFTWNAKPSSWIPFAVGVVLLLVALLSWFVSRKDIDLDGALPITVKNTNTGIEVTADLRMLTGQRKVAALGEALLTAATRDPLPEPDGLVSDEGLPMPERKEDAMRVVAEINEKVHADCDSLNKAIEQSTKAHAVVAWAPELTPVADFAAISNNKVDE